MHAFKPLLPLAGKPLLLHVIHCLQASGAIDPILVVTGHRAPDIRAALAGLNVASAFNPNYAGGEMLSSLRVGIRTLFDRPTPPTGFLLAFADQPAVLSATIRALVASFHAHHPPLAIPLFADRRGHPLLISSTLIPEIAALDPADSLRTVVHRHLPRAVLVTVDDPSVLDDLDTPEDLARARQALGDPGSMRKSSDLM
jgi:molybdenum cofactor cytidylyltransferase